MHDGKSLQSGTSHYFGTGFAEAFGIKFQDQNNQLLPAHQTSWGVSTRLLGSLIMVHGDDNGLVLPPLVAPIQIVIVPIMQQKPGVLTKAKTLFDQLKTFGYRVKMDDSNNSPGWKFAEYEMKGVPIRLEIGPRDMELNQCVLVQRNTKEKHLISLDQLSEKISSLFTSIHQQMFTKASKHLQDHITEVDSLEALIDTLNTKGGYVKASVCEDPMVEEIIKEKAQATARVIPFNQMGIKGKCIITGKPATRIVYFARAY